MSRFEPANNRKQVVAIVFEDGSELLAYLDDVQEASKEYSLDLCEECTIDAGMAIYHPFIDDEPDVMEAWGIEPWGDNDGC